MADSNQQIACGAVIGVPIVVSFVALLFYLFYAPAKVLITSFFDMARWFRPMEVVACCYGLFDLLFNSRNVDEVRHS